MALIKCPECNREISDKAISCPHCGFRLELMNEHPSFDKDFIKALNHKRNQALGLESRDKTVIKKQSEKVVKKKKITDNVFFWIAITIVLFILYEAIGENSHKALDNNHHSSGNYLTTTCEWCGQKKECQQYCVQIIDGYNSDGTHKFKYDYVWIDSGCIGKARENCTSKGWLDIQATK